MRERLAVARSQSRFDVCAGSAWADPLGNLLLRGLDNDDGDCLRRAKRVLADIMCRRSGVGITQANAMVVEVLRYLKDQRCGVCEGRQFIRQDASVRACLGCNGRGLQAFPPVAWRRAQLQIMYQAQAAMGRALNATREQLEADQV
jgi:hypothetical protein